MKPERLVYMANQIADFFRLRPEPEAAASTEDHLVKFWDPRMRTQLLAHVAAGGQGLNPIARQAAERLAARVARSIAS